MAGSALRTFQRRVKHWRELHGASEGSLLPAVAATGSVRTIRLDAREARGFFGDDQRRHFRASPYASRVALLQLAVGGGVDTESSISLRRGVQAAFRRLGGVTPVLQTDCSSAATHQIERHDSSRSFNDDYLEFCRYLKITPRTIHVSSPDENADVETAHRHLKRRIRNHLALRGSHDFSCEADYAVFVAQICEKANDLRADKVSEELPLLRALPARRFPETQEVTALVTRGGTITVNKVPYTVPPRLIGTTLSVQVGERELRFCHGNTVVLQRPKATAENPGINYRHLIDWLLKKPGAFRNYVHREALFPDICFRQACGALRDHEELRADRRYLQLSKLAAEGSEASVSDAIGACLRDNVPPLPERIEKRLARKALRARSILESIKPLEPSLSEYAVLAKEVCA